MLNRNKKVVSLEEDFSELGLDAGKMIGSMERNTALVEERSAGTPRSAGPPISTYGEPAHVADKALLESDGGHEDDDVDLDEGVQRRKKKTGSAAKKAALAGKLARRSTKGLAKTKGKAYRKTHKKQIKVRRKKLARMGSAKKGFIRQFASADSPDGLDGLREDLVTSSGAADFTEDTTSSFEEAALNASYLCSLLSEVFGALGENDTASAAFEISESGTSLSDDLAGITSEEEMTEEQKTAFDELIGFTVKGLRFWEGLGGPSLGEAIEIAEFSAIQE